MAIRWDAALAWRAARHFLSEPAATVAEAVARLISVPANSGDAETAIGIRLARPGRGAVADALASGELVKAYAFGGASHLMTPAVAADVLALRGASRQWARSSWQKYYDLPADRWPALREVVAEALAGGPLTQGELAAAVATVPGFAHLREPLSNSSHTLLKPLSWQGVMSFGPSRDGQFTFQSLAANTAWPGLPDVEEAGPRALAAYLSAYGPATRQNLHMWFTDGLSVPRRLVERWLVGIETVQVEGQTAYITEPPHAEPDDTAHLLPAFDRWLFGPGTDDAVLVPPAHRQVISRGAAVITVGGRAAGTWTLIDAEPRMHWFAPENEVPVDTARLKASVRP